MSGLRRAVVTLVLGAIAAAVLKFRGTHDTPAREGGWRELDGPDLR